MIFLPSILLIIVSIPQRIANRIITVRKAPSQVFKYSISSNLQTSYLKIKWEIYPDFIKKIIILVTQND